MVAPLHLAIATMMKKAAVAMSISMVVKLQPVVVAIVQVSVLDVLAIMVERSPFMEAKLLQTAISIEAQVSEGGKKETMPKVVQALRSQSMAARSSRRVVHQLRVSEAVAIILTPLRIKNYLKAALVAMLPSTVVLLLLMDLEVAKELAVEQAKIRTAL